MSLLKVEIAYNFPMSFKHWNFRKQRCLLQVALKTTIYAIVTKENMDESSLITCTVKHKIMRHNDGRCTR